MSLVDTVVGMGTSILVAMAGKYVKGLLWQMLPLSILIAYEVMGKHPCNFDLNSHWHAIRGSGLSHDHRRLYYLPCSRADFVDLKYPIILTHLTLFSRQL